MESEAVISVEGSAYFIVYEWVPLNLIFASMKKPGQPTPPGFRILQKLSHIVHALIYNLMVLYLIKQRPIADIEQFGRFPPVPVGLV